jgi:hypothetical protein
VWTIQETILSKDLWVACGYNLLAWNVLADACTSFSRSGISRWLQERFGDASLDAGQKTARRRKDVLESTAELNWMRILFGSTPTHPGLFQLLVATRPAECYDPRDKIYGLLGICEDSDRAAIQPSYALGCTAESQYHAEAVQFCLSRDTTRWNLGDLLLSVDHEPSPGLPSWVPDWRKPRETASLGTGNRNAGVYNARGWVLRMEQPVKDILRITGKDNEELRLPGSMIDTLTATSPVFVDPDLSATDPTVTNKTLLSAVDFVTQITPRLQPPTDDNTIFSIFWKTLVAGKDDTNTHAPPRMYAEIISLLLDETTGRSPTLPGQETTYIATIQAPGHNQPKKARKNKTTHPQQDIKPAAQDDTRPTQKHRLTLTKLTDNTSRRSKATARAFQALRTAFRNAMHNRRLGVTEQGRLGLFPRHARVGDQVWVLQCGHVPFVLRSVGGGGGGQGTGDRSGDGDGCGRYQVVGECYVDGIMNGEVVKREGMEEITLV